MTGLRVVKDLVKLAALCFSAAPQGGKFEEAAMNKTSLPIVVILFAVCLGHAHANGIFLTCEFPVGPRVALEINKKSVLKSGKPIKNLNQRSVAIKGRYITFNQAFNNYNNAWRINRNTLKVDFKTVLKRDSRVVLDEKGSCANAAIAAQPPQRRRASSLPASLSFLHLQ
ncbi:MAG: hypothetical protein ACLPPF_16700 [Rhodomicrobium sp.]